jgi:hypothetical protein
MITVEMPTSPTSPIAAWKLPTIVVMAVRKLRSAPTPDIEASSGCLDTGGGLRKELEGLRGEWR